MRIEARFDDFWMIPVVADVEDDRAHNHEEVKRRWRAGECEMCRRVNGWVDIW